MRPFPKKDQDKVRSRSIYFLLGQNVSKFITQLRTLYPITRIIMMPPFSMHFLVLSLG